MLLPVYIHSKLRYIFASTCFTKQQCNSFDRIFRPVVLSKMGVASTTNKTIVHSSYRYNGLQIPTSWNLQGSLHSQLLIGHSQFNDLIGQHIKHISDYLYLHIGLKQPIFTYDYNTIKDLIPPCWHAITWEYLCI